MDPRIATTLMSFEIVTNKRFAAVALLSPRFELMLRQRDF